MLSAPAAGVITVLMFLVIYNQVSPKPFLYKTPETPGKVYIEVLSEKPVVLCHCGWMWPPTRPETSNQWTNHDKPATEAPKQNLPEPSKEFNISEGLTYEIGPCRGQRSQSTPQLNSSSIQYPQACIKKGIEGVVVTKFDVTEEGRVINIVILESPDECFRQPVITMLQKWRYSPQCRRDGTPAKRVGVVESFNFKLAD
jgi:TonB family protein